MKILFHWAFLGVLAVSRGSSQFDKQEFDQMCNEMLLYDECNVPTETGVLHCRVALSDENLSQYESLPSTIAAESAPMPVDSMNLIDFTALLRSQKRRFLQNFLLSKFNSIFGDPKKPSRKIRFRIVNVIGWPEEIKTFQVKFLTNQECLILFERLHGIKFVLKREHARLQPSGSAELNRELYAELKDACVDLPEIFCSNRILWDQMHKKAPEMRLSTLDYRRWSFGDRKVLRNLILNDLIPKLKALK